MRERIVVLGSSANRTNVQLVLAWRRQGIDAQLATSADARRHARPGVVLLGRLDVLPGLDGIEPGLLELLLAERAPAAHVLNTASALLATHDKRRTARLLSAAGVPHPATELVRGGEVPELGVPLVVKPPFGSWGVDVFRCESWADVTRVLHAVRERAWFRRHGALLQELVPPRGYDLRLLVAGGRVVGAANRVSAPGEWRTNVALGGTARPVQPGEDACALACMAAQAVSADLVGVDLLPRDDGSFVVLELNGAVEFTSAYGLSGRDVYRDVADALGLVSVQAGMV